MITLVGTKHMLLWLDQNLNKFKLSSNTKSITARYEGSGKNGEKFKITVYSTNTITMQGNVSDRIYKQLILASNENNFVGCDEVGVGDFFGPTVYVSCELDALSIKMISKSQLPIKDSKNLKDIEILNIYNQLKNNVKFSQQIVFDKDFSNLNSIAQKTYYHHQNINNHNYDANFVIDLFTTERSFYKYSTDLNIKWPDNLHLETKADSKFLSVALASIFARAIFLQEMKKLEDKYNFEFVLGAGNNVIPVAKNFISIYSKDELASFCKTSFKTFDHL